MQASQVQVDENQGVHQPLIRCDDAHINARTYGQNVCVRVRLRGALV